MREEQPIPDTTAISSGASPSSAKARVNASST